MIKHSVDRNSSNMRLDRYLRKSFPLEGLSTFFSILRKKKVRVNGKIAKANTMLFEGDEVCIYENLKVEENKPVKSVGWVKGQSLYQSDFLQENLNIVRETEDYLIVNKPSGIASQPGTGTKPGESLVELLWKWGLNNSLDFKPTIAHRLDKETSGLLLVALHGDTLRTLNALIREHKVQKFYYALVKGNLKCEKGTIEMALERTDCARGSKMKISESENSAKAITHYAVNTRYEGYDLLKIRLETGKMHQIRAHFAAIGHPLLGDSRYGDFPLNREFKKLYNLDRLFLHSTRLEFEWNNKRIVEDCPMPKELHLVLKSLKKLPL